MTDVYCYAESVPETGAEIFNSVQLGNATLHVPATSIDTYKATEPWKNFGYIVALPEIVPMEENVEITFDKNITTETDLKDIVINNVYLTLDTEGDDHYDTNEKCIVVASIVTNEQLAAIEDQKVGDVMVKEKFNGLIIEVPKGKGVLKIDAQTKGTRAMSVKIGDAEAQTFVQPERGLIEIPYNVTKDTYVYIYGAHVTSGAQHRTEGNSENGVLIYGIKWVQGDATDIDAVTLVGDGTFQIYTLDGKQVNALQQGVNIIRYYNGTSKKVYVK